ncbi:MAG: S8 family serine peptidase [Gaiellaceae bacterium]
MARFHRFVLRGGLRAILLTGALACVGVLFTTTAGAGSHHSYSSVQTAHTSPSAESIVRFDEGTSAADMQQIVTDAGGEVASVMPEVSAVAVRTDSADFAAEVSADPKVTAVFVDRYISWGSSENRLPGKNAPTSFMPKSGGHFGHFSFPDPLHDAAAPNAEGIVQWDDNRMDVPDAWRKTTGDKSIVVAVLDTGVQGNTTELRQNFDSRTSENALDCKSIIRDYGLGFLTDYGILDECRNGDRDGHGTWVAGRIGAAANGFGSNGVAPKVTIRSYKVLAGEFGGLTSWIVNGMLDACQDGADILNMSIEGYDDPTLDADAQDYLLWADAVNYCHARGTTIVAAAGNEHVSLDRSNVTVAGRRFNGAGRVSTGSNGIGTVYPGDSLQPYVTDLRGMLLVPGGVPGVIAVSATANEVVNAPDADPSVRWPAKWLGARDQLAYYSNYGSRIDLAAPGGSRKFNIALFDGGLDDVLTGGYGSFSAVDPDSAYCTDPELSASYNSDCFSIAGQGFAWSQGTSMSAPNVTGVAVLTLATHPRLRHNPDALRARLQQTANDHVRNYTGPNDPNNKTAAIDGTPCDTGYCHLDFKHPISSGDAFGAGIVDAGDAVS